MEQMQQTTAGPKKHKKLKILLVTALAFVVGFFIYKYSYIYLERQKYEKVESQIVKVADDLRAQGINTTSYKDCEHAQVKFGKGFLSCYSGILYEGSEETRPIKIILETTIKSVQKFNFSLISEDGLSPTMHPINVAASVYSLQESPLQCRMSYDKEDDLSSSYTLSFECGRSSKYKLF